LTKRKCYQIRSLKDDTITFLLAALKTKGIITIKKRERDKMERKEEGSIGKEMEENEREKVKFVVLSVQTR
jgi:hypothetical protein